MHLAVSMAQSIRVEFAWPYRHFDDLIRRQKRMKMKMKTTHRVVPINIDVNGVYFVETALVESNGQVPIRACSTRMKASSEKGEKTLKEEEKSEIRTKWQHS